MLENETFLYISYSTCPTVYVNTHLSCLTYGRVPTKGRNYVGTRNLHICCPFPAIMTSPYEKKILPVKKVVLKYKNVIWKEKVKTIYR